MNILFRNGNERGFGTYPLRGAALEEALALALDAGYRAVDTAQMYGNEADVGRAIAASGLRRAELCITTKVHPDNFIEGRFADSVKRSLRDLRVDHVDVLLLHWPPIGGDILPGLRMLEEAHANGHARHIGVSNYTAAMMKTAKAAVSVPLVTNQVEFHPLLDQSRLLAASVETGMPLSSYSSVARGEVFRYPLFAEIGAAYGKSAAQIVLRWILQKGVTINTMSTRRENIIANFDVMDFTLSTHDVARIDALCATNYRIVTRDKAPWAPQFD